METMLLLYVGSVIMHDFEGKVTKMGRKKIINVPNKLSYIKVGQKVRVSVKSFSAEVLDAEFERQKCLLLKSENSKKSENQVAKK